MLCRVLGVALTATPNPKPGVGHKKFTSLLGGRVDLVSRVSKVGYGDYNRVSRAY